MFVYYRYLEIVQTLPMYSYHYFEVKVSVQLLITCVVIKSMCSIGQGRCSAVVGGGA